MGQGIISRSNPGNSGDKVGDIRITTRNTLGEKWALCNGENVPSGADYATKFTGGNPANSSAWGVSDRNFDAIKPYTSERISDPLRMYDVVYAGDGNYYYWYASEDLSSNSYIIDIYIHNIYTNAYHHVLTHQTGIEISDTFAIKGIGVSDNKFFIVTVNGSPENTTVWTYTINSDFSLTYSSKENFNTNSFDFSFIDGNVQTIQLSSVIFSNGHCYFIIYNYNDNYAYGDALYYGYTYMNSMFTDTTGGCRYYPYEYNGQSYLIYFTANNMGSSEFWCAKISDSSLYDIIDLNGNSDDPTIRYEYGGIHSAIRISDNEVLFIIVGGTDLDGNTPYYGYIYNFETSTLEELGILDTTIEDAGPHEVGMGGIFYYNGNIYIYAGDTCAIYDVDLKFKGFGDFLGGNWEGMNIRCRDDVYLTGYIVNKDKVSHWSEELGTYYSYTYKSFCSDIMPLPTIPSNGEANYFIKIKD